MEILTKRPQGMSFIAYRNHLRKQNKWIKNRIRCGIYKKSDLKKQKPFSRLRRFFARKSKK
ncbi:hypothetical protein EZS27_031411 [termite gut metagenome]|uniref:Uncharacterized protein n=1 Tax=termite gut metagenome TaxID=433724 RepID=A0A5J4QDE6_9ZZZZ